MIPTRRFLQTALFAMLAAVPLAAQQPPDPATHPNVKDVQISKDNINSLEVNKNNTAKVKEIWKYNPATGLWVKVWDLDNGGDFILTNNNTKKSKVQNNPTTQDFTKDDKFRIVAEATGSDGNSTIITSIAENT